MVSLSAPLAAVAGGYLLVVRGALTIDLGVGRRVRPLGPITRLIAAPPEVVFDVIAGPYLGRTPRAMQDKVRVWEQSGDMVLAKHLTKTGRLTTATLATVRFERPHRVTFRLVRGPVPHVAETYELRPAHEGTAFLYTGELGTDLWRLGQWWADRLAIRWENTVVDSLDSIQTEAERLAASHSTREVRTAEGGVSPGVVVPQLRASS
jgi:polyketide cyclase/dehydrase/lipid transport protein